MHKKELIEHVASIAEISKVVSGKAVNAVFSAITETLKEEEKVQIVGFGSFSVIEAKATQGRNPRTGETIAIDAKKRAKFSAGKILKEAVNS